MCGTDRSANATKLMVGMTGRVLNDHGRTAACYPRRPTCFDKFVERIDLGVRFADGINRKYNPFPAVHPPKFSPVSAHNGNGVPIKCDRPWWQAKALTGLRHITEIEITPIRQRLGETWNFARWTAPPHGSVLIACSASTISSVLRAARARSSSLPSLPTLSTATNMSLTCMIC